ncbi:MAG: hypothetical protein EHM89_00370 [Acidobacteria bacterium]|nr:MAG: hypothetical protein EHM89_00370 [Acidobacteriota bacterium]
MIHVYTAKRQPATRYRVPGFDYLHTTSPHAFVWCRCCKQRRRARFVELQVYYDMTNAWCRPGKGCKKS